MGMNELLQILDVVLVGNPPRVVNTNFVYNFRGFLGPTDLERTVCEMLVLAV
jgi:hypothetical protein